MAIINVDGKIINDPWEMFKYISTTIGMMGDGDRGPDEPVPGKELEPSPHETKEAERIQWEKKNPALARALKHGLHPLSMFGGGQEKPDKAELKPITGNVTRMTTAYIPPLLLNKFKDKDRQKVMGRTFYHIISDGRRQNIERLKKSIDEHNDISVYNSLPSMDEMWEPKRRPSHYGNMLFVFQIEPEIISLSSKRKELNTFASDYSQGNSFRIPRIFMPLDIVSNLKEKLTTLRNNFLTPFKKEDGGFIDDIKEVFKLEDYRKFENQYKEICTEFFSQPGVFDRIADINFVSSPRGFENKSETILKPKSVKQVDIYLDNRYNAFHRGLKNPRDNIHENIGAMGVIKNIIKNRSQSEYDDCMKSLSVLEQIFPNVTQKYYLHTMFYDIPIQKVRTVFTPKPTESATQPSQENLQLQA
jgi:hypothetical protein